MSTTTEDIDLDAAIEKLRVKQGVPRALLDRMLSQESGGNDAAVSPLGAKSRFQVMPATFDLYNKQVGGVLKSDSPLDNAYVGLKLLSDNYKRFRPKAKNDTQGWALAVAGYHGNPEAVEKDLANGGNGIPDQGDGLINTRDHVYRIFNGLNLDETKSQPPKRESVTSVVKDYEPEPIKPIQFEADDANEMEKAAGLNILARSARTVQEKVSTAGVDTSSSPDVIGKRVALTFDHPPTPEEVSDAYFAQHGLQEVAQRFKQETGGLLGGIEGSTTPIKTANGYVVNLRPTRAAVDAINAYASGGMEKLQATLLGHQQQRVKLHNDVVMAGDASGLKGDAKKLLASQILAADQLAENIKNLGMYGGPNYDPEWKSASAIAESRSRLPPTRTSVGSVAEIPVEAAGTIGRVAMFGPAGMAAFPLEQGLEHAHEGPEGAAKATILTLPMVAVGPIGRSIGTDAMSPLARQLALRSLGAGAMAETAAVQGASPKEILKDVVVGGLFPTGKRGIPERPTELGIRDIVHHSNYQPRTEAGTFEKGEPLKLPTVEESESLTAKAFTQPERVLRSELAAADRQLTILNKAGGATKKTAKMIRRVETVRGKLQTKLDEITSQKDAERQSQVEATRYSETPRFDEWAENQTGQRLSQLEPAELEALGQQYREQFGQATPPPILREMPPLANTSKPPTREEIKAANQPPPRHVVEHADTITKAIGTQDTAKLNTILDELGVTNEDIQTARQTTGKTSPPPERVGEAATPPSPESTPGDNRTAERSFPVSLEKAGLPKGSDLRYNVQSHAETDARAQQILSERGEQQATVDVLQASEMTPELVRTGQILIRRLDDVGKTAEADALAEALSRKGTQYGQVVDAFSMVEGRRPKDIVNYVEKQIQKEQPTFKMSDADRGAMETLAGDFQKFRDEQGTLIAELQSRVGKLESKPPSRVAVAAQGLQARLDSAADAARARLKERQEAVSTGGSQSGASAIPADIADYAIIGAAKLAKGGLSIAQWTDEMAGEFGEWVRDDFKRLYKESFRLYDAEKVNDKTAREAKVTEGMTPTEAKQKIRELSAARVNGRRARIEMQELYQTMQRSPGEKVGAQIMDAVNVPRSLMSSGDLSEALRQNSVFSLTEFKLAKQHAGRLFGSLKESVYQDLMSEIESNADFLKVRDGMGVSFTSPELKRGHGLSSFDEYFPSQTAEKLPVLGAVVRASERAFTGPLDWARMTWGERFSKEIESYAAENDWTPQRTETALKQAGKFINAATGRGELSGKGKIATTINEFMPFLNTVFFSPRYQLSRLQLLNMSLNPVAIMRMEAPVRRIVLRKMWRYYGTQAAIQVGASALGAQTNTTDPGSPDWLKLKAGNTRYDLNAGLQQNLRIMYNMSLAFARYAAAEKGGNAKEIQDAKNEVVGRGKYFLRSKLAPIPSFGWDWAAGEDINREPFTITGQSGHGLGRFTESAVTKRLIPLYLQDMYDGWKEENGIGGKVKATAKSVPAVFGVGMQTYDERSRNRPPARPSRSSIPARPQ